MATLGGQMVGVAVGWHLYEVTHSALALGIVGLVQIIPVLLLSLPAGHLADRGDRKRIVLMTRAALGICSLGLALVTWTNGAPVLIYACLFGIGVARSFNSPASSTLLPQTVPAEAYTNASMWSSNAWQLAAAIGPALGGAIIALSRSATPVYLLDVAAAVAYIVLISLIRSRPGLRPASKAGTWESLAEGIRFLRSTRLLLAVITLDLFAVVLGGAVTLLPVFAKDILHVGPSGLGWLRAAPSVGAVGMAFLLAHLPPLRQAGKALLWAVAGFGLATIVFGFSQSFFLSLAMLALLGALDNVSVVVRSTLLLVTTPNEMLGRIASVNSIFVGASNELGGFESGLTAAWFGPVVSVVAGGIGTIVVVIATALIWPELRRLGSLHDQARQ